MESIDDLAGARGTSFDDPSGALRAQQAHDAGAVEPVVELPVHVATVIFRVHATREEAEELAHAVGANVALHRLVLNPITVSIEEPA